MKSAFPSTNEYLENVYNEIFGYITKSKNVHLTGLSSIGIGALMKFITYSDNSKKFKSSYSKSKLIYLDCQNIDNEQAFWYQVATQLDANPSEKLSISYLNVSNKVQELTRDEDYFVVFILYKVNQCSFLDDKMINRLIYLTKINMTKVKFIVTSTIGSRINLHNILGQIAMFDFTEIYIRPHELTETKKQILHNIQKNNITTIKTNEVDDIAPVIQDLSGGIPGLSKKLLSLTPDQLREKPFEILKNDDILIVTSRIISDFDEEAIKELSNKSQDQLLQKAGLLDENYNIKSKLLSEYLKKYNTYKMRVSSNKPEDILSEQELSVFTLLKENKEEIVTRESIAKVMWDENYTQNYSDWAIDSLISRIRKKVPNEEIVTSRGKGFLIK